MSAGLVGSIRLGSWDTSRGIKAVSNPRSAGLGPGEPKAR